MLNFILLLYALKGIKFDTGQATSGLDCGCSLLVKQ